MSENTEKNVDRGLTGGDVFRSAASEDEVVKVDEQRLEVSGALALMVDLETLATTADAVVTEVGARFFNPLTGGIGEGFESECCVEGQIRNGRRVCAETLGWYGENGLLMAGLGGEDPGLGEVLGNFSDWVVRVCAEHGVDVSELRVWAKGGMDTAILDHAFGWLGAQVPWRYSNVRDLRTFYEAVGYVPKKVEVAHFALADCDAQICDLVLAVNFNKGGDDDLLDSVRRFLSARRSEHLAVRLNDEEMQAMQVAVNERDGYGGDANG